MMNNKPLLSSPFLRPRANKFELDRIFSGMTEKVRSASQNLAIKM